MKKLLTYSLVWIVILIYMTITLSFVAKKESGINCRQLRIYIADYPVHRFISKHDILSLMEKHQVNCIGKLLPSINTHRTESLLYALPAVKQAEVYITSDSTLNIYIKQRTPILRIIDSYHRSYYIDEEGIIMPSSENFSAYTLLATGYITEWIPLRRNQSIFLKDSTGQIQQTQLTGLYTLASYINDDELWKSQIEHIYVNPYKEYVLIPRVGSHVILFGDIERMEGKFNKLRKMYKVMNATGWNVYSVINLKYKNQIVCTRK